MAGRSTDELLQRVETLIQAEAPNSDAMKQALKQLSGRFVAQQNLLDRLIGVLDRQDLAALAARPEMLPRPQLALQLPEPDTSHGELAASQKHYREIFDHAPLAFLLLDCVGNIEDWNQAAENIFGWRREEVIGQNAFELLAAPAEREVQEGLMSTALQARIPTHSVNRNRTRWGKEIVCEWNNVLRFDSFGDPVGILSLGIDITERLRLESDLRRAKEEAEQALEDQRHFLAMASHEFRSPLAVVDSAAQLLELRCRGDADSLRVVERIRRAVRRLSAFLENCLTEDRLDTQHWSLSGETFALPEFMRAVVEQMQQMTSHHWVSYVEQEMPTSFYGDPHLLRVMLNNLIENAIKYSPAGGQITVSVATTPDQEICITVKDQGIGIPREDQARVFSKYFRGQVGGGISGAGLGLYLVARIVALHKGKIDLESVPGQGASFSVTLPILSRGAHLQTKGSVAR